MKYKIKGACKSVTGNVRPNNEDNYFFNYQNLKEDNNGSKILTSEFCNTDNVIAAVFDGMGGEEKGEKASFLASATLKMYLEKNTNKSFLWQEYIELANNNILNEKPKGCNMGTTVAGIIFTEKNFNICNLGDSRIYGFKHGKLKQLSYDHTEANLHKKLNIDELKSRLMQHLGLSELETVLVPYIKKFTYRNFDKILICTDGLTDMLNDEVIAKILKKHNSVKKNTEDLINTALSKGGIDNTTVMVFKIEEAPKNYFRYLVFIATVIALILLIIFYSKEKFNITKDNYDGPITVGDNYEFSYTGNAEIHFSNDNIIYQKGKIYALKEGLTVLTLKNKKGEVLYEKTIKIFPK